MKKEPLVSITLTTYNRKDLLKKTLDSIINQTYKNIEIIIGDNHSEDGTKELCEEYAAKDSRIKYYRHPENIGLTGNSNFVPTKITGEYYIGTCDDDWLDLDYIEKCVEFLNNNPDYIAIYSLTKLYDENYNLISVAKPQKFNYSSPYKRVKKYVTTNISTFCIGLYRRKVLDKMFETDGESFKHRMSEDWVFMIKHLVAGKAAFLTDVYYNKLHNGLTRNVDATAQLWNVEGLNGDNFWDKLAESVSGAILEDKFFTAYLSQKEIEKLAKIVYDTAIFHRKRRILTYIKRHPFFLFRKDFYKVLKANI